MLQVGAVRAKAPVEQSSSSGAIPEPVMSVINAVETSNLSLLNLAMACLVQEAGEVGLPKPFLSTVKRGLETEDWGGFARALRSFEFLGEEGRFFLLAPYTTSRGGKPETQLSAIYARRLDLGEIPETHPVLWTCLGECVSRFHKSCR